MPIVAISRGTFSGGEEVAKAVADRLGCPCVSREVILEEAWKHGVSKDEMTAAMDRRPPFWQRVAGERTSHLILMRAALCEHALQGDLVYHGHLGHLLLPGVSHVLGVRVVADLEFRIPATMQHQQVGRDEALAHITKVDKERRQWCQFIFGVDWDDPGLYDLVVNLSRASVDSACEAIVTIAGQAGFQPTPASSKAMRDLALSSRVAAKLAMEPRTRATFPSIRADDGIVTISGAADSSEAAKAMAAVASAVEGVREVRSEVQAVRQASGKPQA